MPVMTYIMTKVSSLNPDKSGHCLVCSCACLVTQVSKADWLVWMVVFFGCLFVGIDWGLAFGLGLSILIQLSHITFPTLQVLGRIPGTGMYRSVPKNRQCSHSL